jgi:hypothetical protein
MNLHDHLRRQMAFSRATYGPGDRLGGVTDHITKELVEVKEAGDPREWVDLVLLSLDGLWRSLAYDGQDPYIGMYTSGGKKALENNWDNIPEIITLLIQEKQSRNEQRTWPDWRGADPTKAIERDRSIEG